MERRNVISGKMLAVIACILLLVIGISAGIQQRTRQSGEDAGTTLLLCQDGQKVWSCSLRQLMTMEDQEVSVNMKSAKGASEQGSFRGVWLETILEQAGISGGDMVIFTAGDGYSSAASGEELGTVLIAYALDGDTLGYYGQGGTGPMRAVFTQDVYGNRSVQYLTKIDVITK